MFYILLAFLYAATRFTVQSTSECEPSKYLCSGICPRFPEGLQLKSEAVCLQDLESDACVCWLRNPSYQLQSVFRCESKINGSVSQVICNPPKECFSPNPNRPVCMIVLRCSCLPLDTRSTVEVFEHWRKVKAIVHTKIKPGEKGYDGNSVEKIQGDVREFSLKHLLFLLGFVIAPLICWCLLNFFHEGKCRKKTTDPPEAQRIPTTRSSTVDNMNNNDDNSGEQSCEEVVVVTSNRRLSSIRPHSVSVPVPSAPEDSETSPTSQQQTLLKCESPPPYCEAMERSFNTDFGPPPAYEDAVRGSDINIQQLWQTVFILQPELQDNSLRNES